MTEENDHIIVGRVLSQKKDAERKLALLQVQAKNIGERWIALGESLVEDPENTWFDEGHASYAYSGPIPKRSHRLSDFDPKQIAEVTSEIREAMEQVKRLTSEASKLGF